MQAYGVDISEIEGSPNDYRTLNAFFSRRLIPGARPIHQPRSFLSACTLSCKAHGALSFRHHRSDQSDPEPSSRGS